MSELEDLLKPKQVNMRPFHGDNPGDEPLRWFWRCESACYRYADGSISVGVHFERWFIIGATPKMLILNPYPDFGLSWKQKMNKRVLKQPGRKRFAYPTRKEAWDSWCVRQNWRLHHARTALEYAEATNRLIAEHPWTEVGV